MALDAVISSMRRRGIGWRGECCGSAVGVLPRPRWRPAGVVLLQAACPGRSHVVHAAAEIGGDNTAGGVPESTVVTVPCLCQHCLWMALRPSASLVRLILSQVAVASARLHGFGSGGSAAVRSVCCCLLWGITIGPSSQCGFKVSRWSGTEPSLSDQMHVFCLAIFAQPDHHAMAWPISHAGPGRPTRWVDWLLQATNQPTLSPHGRQGQHPVLPWLEVSNTHAGQVHVRWSQASSFTAGTQCQI